MNGVTLKTKLGVVQGHGKWRRSIDHVWQCGFKPPRWLNNLRVLKFSTLLLSFCDYRLANRDSYSEYDISRCIQQITSAIQVRDAVF